MTARERLGAESTQRPLDDLSTSELLLAVVATIIGGAGWLSWAAWLVRSGLDGPSAGAFWRHDLVIAVAGVGAGYSLMWQRGSRTWRYAVGAVVVAVAAAVVMAVTH